MVTALAQKCGDLLFAVAVCITTNLSRFKQFKSFGCLPRCFARPRLAGVEIGAFGSTRIGTVFGTQPQQSGDTNTETLRVPRLLYPWLLLPRFRGGLFVFVWVGYACGPGRLFACWVTPCRPVLAVTPAPDPRERLPQQTLKLLPTNSTT